MAPASVKRQLDGVAESWTLFRGALDRLPVEVLEHVTPAGWTLKEMLAHIAFWEETVKPVFVGWFRGEPDQSFEGWYGGDDLGLTRGYPWPVADVHNAREAAWARGRTTADVVARLDRAHRQLVEVVESLSEDEANNERYTEKIASATWRHYAKHLPEIEALLAEPDA